MKRFGFEKNKLFVRGMAAGSALGVLTALVFGAGSALGAEAAKPVSGNTAAGTQDTAQEGWVVDNVVGAYRYFGADGQMWTNAITPDGYYVDRNGVMIHPQYEIERLTTIPAEAKSLLVIEGHGNAGRATFYLKEETAVDAGTSGSKGAAQNAGTSGSKSAAGNSDASGNRSTVSRQGPGEAAQTGGKASDSASGTQKKVSWKTVFNTNATLGRLGIGKEVEGDEKTPRGFYTLDIAFGTEPDPGNFKVPYLQVHDGHYWVGDSESSYYNQLVDIRQTGEVFDKRKSEHLSTIAGIGYHYCMSVGYNKACTPYKGSAIFLHCIEGPVTAGCIGIPKEDMVTLLENIQTPAYILIDDGENFQNYY